MARIVVDLELDAASATAVSTRSTAAPGPPQFGLQSRQPGPQTSQPTPLLVNLLPPTLFLGLRNLPFRLSNSPLQAVHPQPLRRPHRRHLALQRHPHGIEHPGRYPVPLQVRVLQRCLRPACRNLGKQLPLHLTVKARRRQTAPQRRQPVPCLRNRRYGSDRWRPAAPEPRSSRWTLDDLRCDVS